MLDLSPEPVKEVPVVVFNWSRRAETPAPTAEQPERDARRGAIAYLLTLGALSAITMTLYGVTGNQAFGAIALVSPAIACIGCRLALREGFADVSWRLGGRRTWRAFGIALVAPVVIAGLTYGLAWSTGLAEFDPLGAENPFGGAPVTIGGSSAASFLAQVAVALTVTTVALSLVAIGEELGWRGYLLPRLVQARVRRPVLIHGVIWALWHLPLTFLVGYAAGTDAAIAAPVLVIQITAAAYLIGYLRLSTGSLWPAVLFHGAWNATIQTAYDPATTGNDHAFWVGESGALTTFALVVIALVLARRTWHPLPAPRSAPSVLPEP
ncbi:MAG: CPBP family intramembrane glutamic endopeptidase [Nocardioides sp.]